MKHSKLMKERIRRVNVLFRELGYELADGEHMQDSYTAGFEEEDGFQAGVFIDRESKFLELAFTFSFSPELGDLVKDKFEEMLAICYEFGCYVHVQASPEEIAFSVFSKLYYAGLNYFALKETIRDFREAIQSLQELLEIQEQFGKGEADGDS